MDMNRPCFYDFKLTLDRPYTLDHQVGVGPIHTPYRPDIHYALHMGIMLKGEIVSDIRDYRQTMTPGQVWLTAPWEAHAAVRMKANSELLLCTILLEKLGDIGPGGHSINWQAPFVLHPSLRPQAEEAEDRERVLEFAYKLVDVSKGGNADYANCRVWLTLHELILFLISIMTSSDSSTQKHTHSFERILPAIEYLKKHPHTPLGVDDAADLCELGKSRFCDLFKEVMGISFGKYAIRARLSGASSDIKLSRASLKEIAEKWGFYDESHFYRQFQQTFHCTPGEFRRR